MPQGSQDLQIRRVLCGAYGENAWLVRAENAPACVLIDPGDGLNALEAALADMAAPLGAILLTHGHFDHTLAAGPLAKKHGVPVYVDAADLDMVEDPRRNAYDEMAASLPCPRDVGAVPYPVGDGELLSVCGLSLRLLRTPGHTPGSVCLYDEGHGVLFSGDTLFARGYGRTDLPGGSDRQMAASLMRLFGLPGTVRVCPGHGGESSLAVEKRYYRF